MITGFKCTFHARCQEAALVLESGNMFVVALIAMIQRRFIMIFRICTTTCSLLTERDTGKRNSETQVRHSKRQERCAVHTVHDKQCFDYPAGVLEVMENTC